MTPDPCRAAFEKWFNKCNLKSFYFSKNKNGRYKNTKLNDFYDCWQAAWNARGNSLEQALNRPPKPLPELKKLIEKPKVWDNPADNSQNAEYEK